MLDIRREGVAHAVYAHSMVFASRDQQDMHTIGCSFFIAKYRSQRLRFICSKVLEENEIVVYIGTRKRQKHSSQKYLLHEP